MRRNFSLALPGETAYELHTGTPVVGFCPTVLPLVGTAAPPAPPCPGPHTGPPISSPGPVLSGCLPGFNKTVSDQRPRQEDVPVLVDSRQGNRTYFSGYRTNQVHRTCGPLFCRRESSHTETSFSDLQ